jgi:predicted DNA-binding protein YlxM (UPF0122 family)
MPVTTISAPDRTFHGRAIISKARTLYVVKGIDRSEIAEKLGVLPDTVSNWIFKGGWKAERDRRLQKFEESALAHAQDEHSAFLASVSSQVEELTEDSLEVSRQAVKGGIKNTRELQQASQSAKNYLEMYFKANKLDRGSADINVRAEIVLRLPGEDPPINVTPTEIDRKNEALNAPKE